MSTPYTHISSLEGRYSLLFSSLNFLESRTPAVKTKDTKDTSALNKQKKSNKDKVRVGMAEDNLKCKYVRDYKVNFYIILA